MKLAIVGSRDITDFVLEPFVPIETTVIISGGAKGVDTLAEAYAKRHKLEFIVFKPEYDKYPGRIAPLKRNDQIVEACDMVLAIWDGESRGTYYTIKKAREMGKPVHIEYYDPKESRIDRILKKLPF